MRHRHHRRYSLATILLIIVSGLLIAAIAGWAIVEEGPDWLVVDGLYKPRAHYCPARNSGGHRNPLKISVITHARSENDLN
jgi:hypothetical protein